MKKLLCSLTIFSSLTIFALDSVVIKGGREIRGQINGETESHVDIFTDYGRQLHIHKTRVQNIVRSGQIAAADAAGARLPAAQIQENAVAPVSPKGFYLGGAIGLANSGASIDPAPATPPGSKSGLNIGPVAEFPLTGSFYFQPELLYSQLGFTESATSTIKISALRAPLLGKWKYPLSKKFTLTAFLGPSLALVSSAKQEASSGTTDIKSTTKSTLYFAELGAGIEHPYTQEMNLFLNLRYAVGLNNINNTIGSTTTQKLHSFDVLAGMLFRM